MMLVLESFVNCADGKTYCHIHSFAGFDETQLPAFRELRDTYVNAKNPPASTFVIVRRLVREEFLLEIEAVAVVSE